MTEPTDDRAPPPETPPAEIPLGQRLYDNPMLLLAAGIIVMVVFYTAWGIREVLSLPQATLP